MAKTTPLSPSRMIRKQYLRTDRCDLMMYKNGSSDFVGVYPRKGTKLGLRWSVSMEIGPGDHITMRLFLDGQAVLTKVWCASDLEREHANA